MLSPGLPESEEKRLAVLRSLNLLDSPEDERFDRVTRLAKRLFNVPIAFIALMDEQRNWFISRVGVDLSESPRDISFCGHTILGRDMLIVEDTLIDERFADNPLVLGEHNIRFYAGHPLISVEGEVLGTLCIMDQRPRRLRQSDIEILVDLSAVVKAELNAIELATVDTLTQLANRRGFISQGQERLAWFQRHDVKAALLYFDLNHFKELNATYGHAEGNHALSIFAKEMKRNTRSYDLLARLSDDEFAMLLGHVSHHQAIAIAERMMRSLWSTCATELPYRLSAAYAVVTYQEQRHKTIEALLAEADQHI